MRAEDTLSESQFSDHPMGYAKVKIIGSLGQTKNGARISEDNPPAPIKLGELLRSLEQKYGLDLRRDSILIIVNGVEARALEDLETVVLAEDQVVLIPMFHGG